MLSRLYVLILLFLTEYPGGLSAIEVGIVSTCEKELGLSFCVLNIRPKFVVFQIAALFMMRMGP